MLVVLDEVDAAGRVANLFGAGVSGLAGASRYWPGEQTSPQMLFLDHWRGKG